MFKGVMIIGLSERLYSFFERIAFAKKQVLNGKWTDGHRHKFFSMYLTKNMKALRLVSGDRSLPKYALTVVLPFVHHTWTNQKGFSDDCFVSDLSPAHGDHLTFG